jgi:hypothetical protein
MASRKLVVPVLQKETLVIESFSENVTVEEISPSRDVSRDDTPQWPTIRDYAPVRIVIVCSPGTGKTCVINALYSSLVLPTSRVAILSREFGAPMIGELIMRIEHDRLREQARNRLIDAMLLAYRTRRAAGDDACSDDGVFAGSLIDFWTPSETPRSSGMAAAVERIPEAHRRCLPVTNPTCRISAQSASVMKSSTILRHTIAA